MTFGQAFAPGLVGIGDALVARDSSHNNLPLQLDQEARHPDGSLRFAVLSTRLPRLVAGETDIIGLYRTEKVDGGAANPAAPDELPSGFDLRIDLDTYAAQISQVKLGNREGSKAGLPFKLGETVTIVLTQDSGVVERFPVTIDAKTAGGGYEPLTRLAEAFAALIDRSTRFHAFQVGSNSWENFWITTRDGPGEPFRVGFEYGGEAKLASHIVQAHEERRHYVASAREAIADASRHDRIKTWLNGPVATELLVAMPFRAEPGGEPHPHLEARFALRRYAGSDGIRTDVTVENDWTYDLNPRNWTYDVQVSDNGRRLFAEKNLTHYHHARWHKVFWSPAEPNIAIQYDTGALIASHAIYNYDQFLVAPDTIISKSVEAMGKLDTGPMGSASIQKLMAMAGARDDIGPLPRWTALYLLNMDPALASITFANGDAGGSAPIHFRDRKTDLPISLDDHPGANLEFGEGIPPSESVPPVANGLTPWAPDGAHQPSLAFVPYLVSGDLFYLEELQFWAAWNLGRVNPAYRGVGRGLFNTTELRDQAWSLRTLAQAAYITPDTHPLKGYFVQRLIDNLTFDVAKYVGPAATHGLGWLEEPYSHGFVSPWQNDYMIIVLGGIVDMGYREAEPLLRWMANFALGRWTHEAEGYCWAMAPAYWIHVRSQDDKPFDNYADLFRANWPDVKSCPPALLSGSYPDTAFGYAAIARASLATLVNFGTPGAEEALQRLIAATPAVTAAFASDPTWAVIPPRRPGRQ